MIRAFLVSHALQSIASFDEVVSRFFKRIVQNVFLYSTTNHFSLEIPIK